MKMKKYLMPALVFVLGFAAALAFTGPAAQKTRPHEIAAETARAQAVRAEDVRDVLQAASRGDFAAAARLGENVFVKGKRVENAAQTFAGYETNSFPPFTVYALYMENTPDKTRRVLLTLDGEDRVESFLAEEMSIIQ